MNIFQFFFTFFLLAFFSNCAPLTSTGFLYSSEQLKQNAGFYKDNKNLFDVLEEDSLKTLFDSMNCANFENQVWSYLYKSLFDEQDPPPASLFQKKIKPYARTYFIEKGASQKIVREVSSRFIDVYDLALGFFSNKTRDVIDEELAMIENLKHPAENEDVSPRVMSFVNQFKSAVDEIAVLSDSLNLPCRAPSLSLAVNVAFHRGMNMFEIADLLHTRKLFSKEEFLNACQDQELIHSLLGEKVESLEGYLYPGAYQLSEESGPEELISLMVKKFLKSYQKLSRLSDRDFPRHKAVILASMIEEEAVVDEEKPIISSVFYNRMKIKMKLQSDPTVFYSILRAKGKMPRGIRRADTAFKSPYNTYYVKGLPRGPISNPGQNSLEAVFQPEATPYYYFVSKDGKTHSFSATYEEHLQAVKNRRR